MSKNTRDNILSLIPKNADKAPIVSTQIKELLEKLTELNEAGSLTTLGVIGIKDGGVLTSLVTQDPSLTVIGAIDVGVNNLMDELYEELEEVEMPTKPTK